MKRLASEMVDGTRPEDFDVEFLAGDGAAIGTKDASAETVLRGRRADGRFKRREPRAMIRVDDVNQDVRAKIARTTLAGDVAAAIMQRLAKVEKRLAVVETELAGDSFSTEMENSRNVV